MTYEMTPAKQAHRAPIDGGPAVTDPDKPLYPPLPPPSRFDVWSAMRWHWLAVLLPVVVLAGVAVAAALARTPTYTAETRLSVGRLDASAPDALAGFTGASSSLAETYSRSIRSDAVVRRVAAATDLDRSFVKSSLSASPIPETPVFTVRAETDSAQTSVELSALASKALVDEVARIGRSSPNAGRVLDDFQQAAADKAQAQLDVNAAARAYQRDDSSLNRDRLVDAQADLARAEARATATRDAYVSGHQGQGSVALVKTIERATSANSDRNSVLQLWVFAAALAGLGIGIGVALYRDR